MQSAVQNVIDYRQFERYNPAWWHRWRILLSALDRQNRAVVHRERLQFRLALISSAHINTDDFTPQQQAAIAACEDIEAAVQPWLAAERAEAEKRESRSFAEAWQQLTGFDITDAQAKANWEKQLLDGLAAANDARNAAANEEEARKAAFIRKAEEIRQRRLNQQGR